MAALTAAEGPGAADTGTTMITMQAALQDRTKKTNRRNLSVCGKDAKYFPNRRVLFHG